GSDGPGGRGSQRLLPGPGRGAAWLLGGARFFAVRGAFPRFPAPLRASIAARIGLVRAALPGGSDAGAAGHRGGRARARRGDAGAAAGAAAGGGGRRLAAASRAPPSHRTGAAAAVLDRAPDSADDAGADARPRGVPQRDGAHDRRAAPAGDGAGTTLGGT